MAHFIDRRNAEKNKSAVNRQRFIERYKKQIRSSVNRAISKRSITNIDRSENITIPKKDISEPILHHDKTGFREAVFAGNKGFSKGDTIPRPKTSKSDANVKASDKGEGEDDFVFELSREEFLDLYFDDLALPDMMRKQLTSIPDYQLIRSGITRYGIPANINIIRTMKQATGRRIALSGSDRKRLREAKEMLSRLMNDSARHSEEIAELKHEIASIKKKLKKVPFIDSIDLRYNNRIKQHRPNTQAVMFCIMDVSGSMDETKKEIAKRFFILLYLFLTKSYEKIDLVFIRHHTSAKEVNEHDFFYSRETGGTVVSSALELVQSIINKRYSPQNWNIYAAQASDGDNWNADSPHCKKILLNSIMPTVQYYAYIEIMPRHHQSLWETYLSIRENYPNFSMEQIDKSNNIYPVFRKLFKKREST